MFAKIGQIFGFSSAPKADFVSRTILIVDDNATDLTLIRKMVEKIGHKALTAENGKIGIEFAKTEKPDLILCDIMMPEMDGVDMFKQIKRDEEIKNIPLMFLTSVDTPKTVVECFEMGVENYICKPINPKSLAKQIETIFDEHYSK